MTDFKKQTHKVRKAEIKSEPKVEQPKVEQPKQEDNVKVRKSNKWIDHVRKYAKDNNVSYKEAIIAGKASYVKNV